MLLLLTVRSNEEGGMEFVSEGPSLTLRLSEEGGKEVVSESDMNQLTRRTAQLYFCSQATGRATGRCCGVLKKS